MSHDFSYPHASLIPSDLTSNPSSIYLFTHHLDSIHYSSFFERPEARLCSCYVRACKCVCVDRPLIEVDDRTALG